MRKLRIAGYLLAVLLASNGYAQSRPKNAKRSADEDFAATMQKLRDSWVQEFNAGHADKVAAFYAPDAVLMRWDGTVHGYDSILAEFHRSGATDLRNAVDVVLGRHHAGPAI